MFVPPGHLGIGVHRFGALEDPGQSVIVGGGNRIKLVIVASSTSEGHPKKDTTDGIDLLVDDVHAHLRHVHLGQYFRADRKKTGCNQALLAFSIGRRFEQITSDLFRDELVEWLVGVKGLNHIITVSPRVAVSHIFIETVGICIACHVQPVSAPAFSISGRFEQAIDELRVGVIRLVVQEGRDLFGCWWQSGQIKRQTANQCLPIGLW